VGRAVQGCRRELLGAHVQAPQGILPIRQCHRTPTPTSRAVHRHPAGHVVVHIGYPATDRLVRPQLFNQGSRPVDRPLWTTVSKNGNFLLDIGPRADSTSRRSFRHHCGRWERGYTPTVKRSTTGHTGRAVPRREAAFHCRAGQGFLHDVADPAGPTVTDRAPVPIHNGETISLLGYRGSSSRVEQAANGSHRRSGRGAAVQ
jgi:hypothetical protein